MKEKWEATSEILVDWGVVPDYPQPPNNWQSYNSKTLTRVQDVCP